MTLPQGQVATWPRLHPTLPGDGQRRRAAAARQGGRLHQTAVRNLLTNRRRFAARLHRSGVRLQWQEVKIRSDRKGLPPQQAQASPATTELPAECVQQYQRFWSARQDQSRGSCLHRAPSRSGRTTLEKPRSIRKLITALVVLKTRNSISARVVTRCFSCVPSGEIMRTVHSPYQLYARLVGCWRQTTSMSQPSSTSFRRPFSLTTFGGASLNGFSTGHCLSLGHQPVVRQDCRHKIDTIIQVCGQHLSLMCLHKFCDCRNIGTLRFVQVLP